MANVFTKSVVFSALSDIASAQGLEITVGDETLDTEGLVNFLNHEVELLAKKASNGGKTNKQKAEQDAIKGEIMTALITCDRPVTVSELMNEGGLPYTNQKLSALLRQMVADGLVVKSTEKRKSYFAVASEDEPSAE